MLKSLKYIHHIDFLRAIAVILVILFHLDIQFFKGGFIGVDVFFVISGFLISRNIKHELQTSGSFDFKNFYIGRVRRLLPTLFLVIFLTFIFGFLLFPPSLFSGFVKSMFFSSFATSNFYFLSETSYFDVTASLKPLLHTWSLGIEEQFYLIYPMAFILLLRVFRKNWAMSTVLILFIIGGLFLNISVSRGFLNEILIASFISGKQFSENISSIQFFLLPFRAFEFLLGALIIFLPSFGNKLPVLKTVLNLLGLLLIFLSAILFGKGTFYMSTLNIIPCIGASLFIANAPNLKLAQIYQLALFKMLGKISYTLYLFHWPIIVYYNFLNGDRINVLENMVLLVVMVIISYLVYFTYENPLRMRNSKSQVISNNGLIGVLLLCLIIISNIKVDVANNNGWLWRVGKKTLNNLKALENPVEYNTKNWGAAGYRDYGLLNAGSSPRPDMIWLGDSHAGHYSYGLDSVMSKKNKKSIFMSYGISTLHLPEIYHKKIDSNLTNSHLNKVLDLIKINPQALIVLSHFWNAEMSMAKVKNEETNTVEDLTLDALGYRKVANKILEFSQMIGDRQILVVGESPFKNKNDLSYIDNLLIPKYISGLSPPSSFEPSGLVFDINLFFKSFFADHENIQFIDPTQPLCSDGRCLEQENGNIYFSDKDHLSKSGSLKVVESFESTFLKTINEAKENNTVKGEFSTSLVEIGEALGHTSDKIVFEGWYNAEPQHRWSSGQTATVIFHIDTAKPIKGEFRFDAGIWENQHVSFYLNDVEIDQKDLTGWNKTFSVFFDPKVLNKEENKLKLVFSNAQMPNQNDERIIAFAFRSMRIE
ncbi:MAG: acyltransferase family protein [Maribacter sp.]